MMRWLDLQTRNAVNNASRAQSEPGTITTLAIESKPIVYSSSLLSLSSLSLLS